VQFTTLVATGMDGTLFDPAAIYYASYDQNGEGIGDPIHLLVTSMGIERDGFRGNALVINIGMVTEAYGWSGIYLTQVQK